MVIQNLYTSLLIRGLHYERYNGGGNDRQLGKGDGIFCLSNSYESEWQGTHPGLDGNLIHSAS